MSETNTIIKRERAAATVDRKVKVKKADLDVIRLLSNGKTVAEAAEMLDQNKRTLETRLLILKQLFDCENTTHLACYFIRNKLIY